MRVWLAMTSLSLAAVGLSGCSDNKPGELGLAYSGETSAENVRLLVDETWTDASGKRHVSQEIFDEVFAIIDEAEEFVLLDFFLVNEFLYEPGPGMRNLSREIVDQLVAKRAAAPDVKIIFITDPVNTVYGSIDSPLFQSLEKADVQVVWTDLNKMRDSNPLYSNNWNLFAKQFGVGPGKAMKNPMGDGRISVRSMLKLINFKANHRKVILSEKSLLVTSANPHSASSAHWNVALRVDGAGQQMVLEAESAILRFSGAGEIADSLPEFADRQTGASMSDPPMQKVELLTERRIRERIVELLDACEPGYPIDLCMFYLSHREIIASLIHAKERGCDVRVILDPAKDAFGRTKNGIPNRQSAAKLVEAGIPLRWADTHGEQCHVKMLYVTHSESDATLLLGSCNYTRRNMDDFNCELNLALSGSSQAGTRAREVFDRWWTNAGDRNYTVPYETYKDPSRRRKLRAWVMERTGLCTF